MVSRPRPLPASLPTVFTTAEARTAGVGPGRLSAPDIRRLSRGLHHRRDRPLTEWEVLRAFTRDDPEVTVCGASAARFWGFPLPRAQSPPPGAVPRAELVDPNTGHRLTPTARWHRRVVPDEDVVAVHGLRVTSRVRTWQDLSTTLTPDDLVKIGDHLVRCPRWELEGRSRPYSTPEDLARAVAGYEGRGIRALRRALEDIRIGSDSPAETDLRLALVRAGLPTPSLNVRIHEGGLDLGEPDLSWLTWRTCAEHEGPTHLAPRQLERDIRRDDRRRSQGWDVVRTTARDLREGGAEAVRRVTAALRRHGWPG